MDFGEHSPLQVIAVGLIGACCLAGIVLQFFAWRHLKPGVPRFGHKDALFKKKQEYYTEEGMRYVNMQKTLAYVMAVLFMLVLFGTDPGDDPGDGRGDGPASDGQTEESGESAAE